MFVDIIKAIILGIIEGLTEFLPVSSTGHLIIANKVLVFEGAFANLFSVVIQSGAILAVIIYFRDKLLPKFDTKEHFIEYAKFIGIVCIAIIPAALIGIPFEEAIEVYLFNSTTVAIALIVGAGLLFLADRKNRVVKVEDEHAITVKQAIIVGCFQCLAMIPGMSRSASTIVGGLVVGFSRSVAAEFSFFMSVPTILGASLIKLIKTDLIFSTQEIIVLIVGSVVSFVVAYYVIAFFMNYIKKRDLKIFAYYRIILGILVILLQ